MTTEGGRGRGEGAMSNKFMIKAQTLRWRGTIFMCASSVIQFGSVLSNFYGLVQREIIILDCSLCKKKPTEQQIVTLGYLLFGLLYIASTSAPRHSERRDIEHIFLLFFRFTFAPTKKYGRTRETNETIKKKKQKTTIVQEIPCHFHFYIYFVMVNIKTFCRHDHTTHSHITHRYTAKTNRAEYQRRAHTQTHSNTRETGGDAEKKTHKDKIYVAERASYISLARRHLLALLFLAEWTFYRKSWRGSYQFLLHFIGLTNSTNKTCWLEQWEHTANNGRLDEKTQRMITVATNRYNNSNNEQLRIMTDKY